MCKKSQIFSQTKMPIYKSEASKWVKEAAGLNEAWQQAAERANRELKSERLQKHHRTVSDLVSELQRLVQEQEEEEKKALRGIGQYRLTSALQHLQQTDAGWAAMNVEERDAFHKAYLLTSFPGK